MQMENIEQIVAFVMLSLAVASVPGPTALFFLSFLPQFIDPLQGAPAVQMMILGWILVCTAFTADLLIAVSGGFLSGTLGSQPLVRKIQHRVAGTILVALGLRLAISEPK